MIAGFVALTVISLAIVFVFAAARAARRSDDQNEKLEQMFESKRKAMSAVREDIRAELLQKARKTYKFGDIVEGKSQLCSDCHVFHPVYVNQKGEWEVSCDGGRRIIQPDDT
jgi:hypothetical protein